MDTLRLPAKMENLESLRSFVLDQAGQLGFPKELLFTIDLVVEELVANIIRNAYQDEPGDVEVGCALECDATMRIEIRDEGMPFDPTSREEPDIEQDCAARNIGGLGIYLVRRMANGMHYRREKNQNILSVLFKL
jgi:serine/threonine-protein kinase RsbW